MALAGAPYCQIFQKYPLCSNNTMILFIWAVNAMYKQWGDSHEKYLLTYYLIHEIPLSVKYKTKRASRKINANKKHSIKCDFFFALLHFSLTLIISWRKWILSYCQRKLEKESQSYWQLSYLKVWNIIPWQYIYCLINGLTDHFKPIEYKHIDKLVWQSACHGSMRTWAND